ncbi:MAG: glycoside hydrolase family 65 protein [Betaproteobacteria bacterium]
MAKIADRYYRVDPWRIIEEGFDPARGRVSESVFSLANEYMGVRGYFEEGYGGDRLVGSYINGVYEEQVTPKPQYKGISDRFCFMVNTLDWLHTRITLEGEKLDLAECRIEGFRRALDLRNGVLERSFTWRTRAGRVLQVTFIRFLSMVAPKMGFWRIALKPVNFSGNIEIRVGLDFSVKHESAGTNFWSCPRKGIEDGIAGIVGRTQKSGHTVFAGFRLSGAEKLGVVPAVTGEKYIGVDLSLPLEQGVCSRLDRIVFVHAEKRPEKTIDEVWETGMKGAREHLATSYEAALAQNSAYWDEVWRASDIVIDGDPENQQGIRYCIFQLHQTYHGADPSLNIGAKGLTGEAYNGHTFWDTETYCLPFYLFNNPKAARNLLEYRYRTLPQAMERARALDCQGACYPVATLDGTESCGLWQHASLQLQPTTGVAYGIWHYVHVTGDRDFLYTKGAEVLVQICRFLASRGQWGQKSGKFGYYCVMGPDEFQMMVNNNCYTNYMAQQTFRYALEVLDEMRAEEPERHAELVREALLTEVELSAWRTMADEMKIPYDADTGIYEQHDGYFDLPHIEVDSIPVTDFPLYEHWSYDRIFRNDMIKQPDVLMFMFLYNQRFTTEAKRVNYEYYEPRCVHESSLSPSVHSILAAELGKHDEAFEFFRFATRMDLDNYNRNTGEGLHVTSIAAAWMNVVYGFGCMRSDGDILTFNPSLPKAWASYSFPVSYRGSVIALTVDGRAVTVRVVAGSAGPSAGLPVRVAIYGTEYELDPAGTCLTVSRETV